MDHRDDEIAFLRERMTKLETEVMGKMSAIVAVPPKEVSPLREDGMVSGLFLCFGFKGLEDLLKQRHVTLIHFGKGVVDVSAIEAVVDNFLRSHTTGGIGYPSIHFRVPALFGRDKNIKVLLPTSYQTVEWIEAVFLKPLRDQLVPFLTGAQFGFNPHVTTTVDEFCGHPNFLYLCGPGYQVLRSWEVYTNAFSPQETAPEEVPTNPEG